MNYGASAPVNISDSKGVLAGDNNLQFNFYGGKPTDEDLDKIRRAVSGHGNDSPRLIQLLSRLIDRHDQSAVLNSAQNNLPCRCFVAECRFGDAPEYLAYKLALNAHMQVKGLRHINFEEVEPVNIAFEPKGGGGFLSALEDEVEEEFSLWLQKNQRIKSVYVSSSSGKNVAGQAQSIMRDISKINEQLKNREGLFPCFIILPFFREQYSWWSIKGVRRKLGKLEKQGLVSLPPLTEIEYRHLAAFLPELPKPARRDFKSMFKWQDLNQDFYTCLKENEHKRYRDVIPKFSEILQARWLQKSL